MGHLEKVREERAHEKQVKQEEAKVRFYMRPVRIKRTDYENDLYHNLSDTARF